MSGTVAGPRTAADAFNEASPSGGSPFGASEDAQARSLAQHNANQAPPPAPPPKPAPIMSQTYNPRDGMPWYPNESYEYPGGQPGEDIIGGVKGLVSGDSSVRHPEIPALNLPGLGVGVTDPNSIGGVVRGVFDPKAWGIASEMALSRDPAALERVIQSRIPNAKFSNDEDGRRTVQVPGGPVMYLDRPGFTPQKGLFYGGQGALALATGGRSIPALMAQGGLQHAGSQAGSWALGGATSPVDVLGTAISTALPGAIGAVGSGLIKGYDWLNSDIVPPAADAAKKLGVQGMSAADQAAAWIADRARTLYRWKFAGKPGDITNDPAQLAREDLALNAGSDQARTTMDKFHRTNAITNDQNKRQIIGEIAGDVAPGEKAADKGYAPNEGYFGDKVNDAVTAKANELDAAKKAAWEKLGPVSPSTPAGQSVTFAPEVSGNIMTRLRGEMRNAFGEPQGPNGTYTTLQLGEPGAAVVNQVGQTEKLLQPGGGPRLTPAPYQPFNMGHLQDLRQQFGNIMDRTVPGTPEFRAAARMKAAIDDEVAKAEGTALMQGDPAALANFREANAATRAHAAFVTPDNNPEATGFVRSILRKEAPATGQQTIDTALGAGGLVTPGGGTNGILTHLGIHLGEDARQPLAGAMTMRSLYGTRGMSEANASDPARYDYTSTASRINAQLGGKGENVADRLLTPEAREQLASYRDALNILGASNQKGGPRLNAPGSGYIGMMMPPMPFGLGPWVSRLQSTAAARNAVQSGAEIVKRAQEGANTAAGLQIRLPRASTLPGPDPSNPFYSWQPEAWRSGIPVYRGGGLLGTEAIEGARR